jgi:hypothetical protein
VSTPVAANDHTVSVENGTARAPLASGRALYPARLEGDEEVAAARALARAREGEGPAAERRLIGHAQ